MRAAIFYLLLSVPIILWTLIVVPNYLVSSDLVNFSAALVGYAVAISPIVGGDISVFGEVTPIILAAAIIALMPQTKTINYFAIGLAVISYFLFVHLAIYFASGPGDALLQYQFPSDPSAKKVILNLVSNVRMMTIVISASILGINVRTR